MTKISIITATYNSAATLPDTLRCIEEQDYPHIEHILIDGVSKDNTLEIAGGFPHLSLIRSEPDHGIYDAMNKGLRLATGDVIGILNSDDFYTHPEVLSRVMAHMEHSGADTLYADLEYVQALNPDRVVRHWKAGAYRHGHFLRGWMPPHPTLFVRREVYEKYGGFNTLLRMSADYELMLRMLHRHRVSVCYLPEVIVRMRTGGVSNASFRNRWRANREDRLAWQLNGLQPRFYTTYMKPLSKIGQYFRR
jgi:glycosyltransferase